MDKDKTVTLAEVHGAFTAALVETRKRNVDFNTNCSSITYLRDALVAELYRPAVEFDEGEVYAFTCDNGDIAYTKFEQKHDITNESDRKLSTKEAGATELIEAVEEMIRKLYPTHKGICAIGQSALDKWRGERNES